jgi:hypothetical protein
LKNYWGIEEDADAIPRSSDGQLLFLMEMVSVNPFEALRKVALPRT